MKASTAAEAAAACVWLALSGAGSALAQTTSGNASNGSALFGSHCSSCHSSITNTVKNAAKAGGHIAYSVSQGMGTGTPAAGLSASQYNDIAEHIGPYAQYANPANFPIPYNSAGTPIAIPDIALNTSYGDYAGLRLVSSPSRGSVTFSGAVATYTPTPGQYGTDVFTFEAYRSGGGTSSVRMVTVSIAAPGAPVFTSVAAKTFYLAGSNSFSITASGSPPPTLSLTGTLPSGVTQSAGPGGSIVLSGTPATGTEGSHPLTITASNGIAPAATQNFTLTVAKYPQFINFSGPASQPYSAAPIALSATASSTLAVTFSTTTPSICSVSGSSVTMQALGVCTIAANQAGNATYAPAPQVLRSFTVEAIAQTVTFPPQPAKNFVSGGTFAISPAAFASSGLPITYSSSTAAICTVSGSTVTMVAPGSCILVATQPGDNYTWPASASQAVALNPPPASGVPGLVTSALQPATLNMPYSAKVMVSGATPVTSATVTGLPAGMTATHTGSGNITLSGTPTQGGNFTLTINATNAAGTAAISLVLVVLDTTTYASNVAMMSAGGLHTCALVNGGVQCWGDGYYGQLGNGSTADRMIPVDALPAGSGATAVSSGHDHTCAVVNGGVKCWGYNAQGHLGNGSTLQSAIPVTAIAEGSGVTAVAAGYSHTCAVANGGAQCWGHNTYGQLGNGGTANSSVPTVAIAAGSGVTAITAGQFLTCAVVGGGVKCWGLNNAGQLGDGSSVPQSNVPVQTIAAGSGFTSVDSSHNLTCALRNGGVQCWNSDYRLPTPLIAEGSGVTAIGGGRWHYCVVIAGGVQCWGYNYDGQLGIASNDDSSTPVQSLPAGSGAQGVSGGDGHTCALANGAVQCWGFNGSGQLGNPGRGTYVTTPNPTIPAGSNATAVAVSAGVDEQFSCAVVNGGVQCWGWGLSGQLGNGAYEDSLTPVQAIAAGSNATAVSSGADHTCAVVNGAAKCWGRGDYAQLGTAAGGSAAPIQVTGLASGVTGVSSGFEHSCAVASGGAKCWGRNQEGQKGDGTQQFTVSVFSPVQVSGLTSGVTAVDGGELHSCAVVSGGVKCWGNNYYYQLGDGTNTQSLTPVQVSGLAAGSGATAVSAGTDLSCAIVNGGLQCWGASSYLELPGWPTTPVFGPGAGVTAVSAGRFHVCAVVSGGVQCLGLNDKGQLGNGTTTNTTSPVQVIPPGTGATAISAGRTHTCAAVGGGIVCWGESDEGQLGDPSVLPYGQKVPAAVRIALIPQVISFPALANRLTRDAPFTISAAGGGSGNPVVFSSQTLSICSISGSTVTLTGTAGTCTIAANQAGGGNYLAAGQVTQSFVVSAVPTFTVTPFAGANGSISPAVAQSVTQGATFTFTVAPHPGYLASVGGTCGGSFADGVFTTHPVIANCSVSATFTPIASTAPSAPAIGLVAAGDGEVSIAFSPPISSGTSPVLYYTATCLPGGASASSTSSPIVITGLTNGNTYRCSVTATNSTATSASSGSSNAVTPVAAGAAALWTSHCSACHGATPTGTKLNAAGTTGTVLSRVIAAQGAMGGLASLSAADRAAIAAYTAQQIPASGTCTPSATATTIDVSNHITLGTISFDSVQVVSPPANGTLSAFSGASITYTPNPGFAGIDTFTYRGVLGSPSQLGDSRTVAIAVGTPSTPTLVSVQSRKSHGSAGTFDLPVDFCSPVGGMVTVEPRAGAGHTLVFNFAGAVGSVGAVTVLDAAGNPAGSATATPAGNVVQVALTGVADARRVTVVLSNLNGNGSSASVSVAFQVGDVNRSRSVTAADILATKGRSDQGASAANFKFDVDLSGGVSAADIAGVKGGSGVAIP